MTPSFLEKMTSEDFFAAATVVSCNLLFKYFFPFFYSAILKENSSNMYIKQHLNKPLLHNFCPSNVCPRNFRTKTIRTKSSAPTPGHLVVELGCQIVHICICIPKIPIWVYFGGAWNG
jgi:hypothetical protein